MTATNYEELNTHTGHEVEAVNYAEQNVAVECVECGVVLQDFDKEAEE